VSQPSRLTPDELYALIGLFYARPEELGAFEEVLLSSMPEPYRELLAHTEHMTVTVEQFHKSPVDVHVHQTLVTPSHYAREISLTRQSDGRVVQYGIMRVNLSVLSPEVRREIEAQQTPLGRILIQHDVLRKIHLMSLWKVVPGTDLCGIFGLSSPQVTYGRAAVIDCNGEPAIELLEIVTASGS
jgi:chorismate-pyruvate lyase